MRKLLRKWTLAGGLLPLVIAGQVGTGGLKSAEACTGGAPGADWDEVAVVTDSDAERVPVGTDGFVLLGRSYSGELDAEDPGAWVEVKDEQGGLVAGQLKVLLTRDVGDATERYLAWQANEAQAVGAVLQFTSWRSEAESTETPGKSLELEVVGEPMPLPTPTATIEEWGELGHGVGELTECATWTTCGDSVLSVPSREVRLVSAVTSWELPAIDRMVAWEVWAEASNPRNGVPLTDATSRDFSQRSLIIAGDSQSVVSPGLVAFAEDATDHCVVVVAKDLRTNKVRRSEPLCETDTEPQFALRDHDLGECTDPPSTEALPLWCDEHKNDPRCELGMGGEGGGGGHDRAGAGGDSDPPRPGGGGGGPSDGGCDLAPTGGNYGAMLAALGAAAAWMRRRRRT